MKTLHSYIFLLVLLPFLSSCEEVIELNLQENAGLLVVEGIVSSQEGESYVSLTQTVGFYDPNVFPGLEGATVQISDAEGLSWNLIDDTPGIYAHPDLVGQPGQTYTLTIDVEGEIYTSISTMPPLVMLDSIEAEPFFGGGTDDLVLLSAYYLDPVEFENFYLFRVKENGTFDDDIILNDDVLNNGLEASTSLFGAFVFRGDTVEVIMTGIDEPVYRYFTTLSNVGGDGPALGTPADPESNISNGALGYFSAQTRSTIELVVP